MKNKKLFYYILLATIFVAVLSFDLITKEIINNNLALHEEATFIPYILGFRNEHNFGAAWSILAGKQTLLIIITSIFTVLFAIYIYKNKNKNSLFMIASGMILAGALGNLVDRIFFGYVRDFLKFEFINFPIFNIADTFLVIGVMLIIIYFIITYVKEAKDEKNKSIGK